MINPEDIEKMRLHIGIRSGYKDIRRNDANALVGARCYGDPLKPLPSYEKEIETATAAFQYLSSPLLHDLNRMSMMLVAWEEQIHPTPRRALKEMIEAMEDFILKYENGPVAGSQPS